MKDYDIKRQKLLTRQHFKCASCGKPFKTPQEVQLAHVLIKSKANIKIFGIEVIDHVDNLRATHGGKCNSSVILNRSKKVLVQAHYEAIQAKIEKGE